MSQRFNTLGITRKRYDIYLKAKGKQVMAKKRFSKTSLRKKLDEDDIIKTTLLSTTTKASQIQLAEMSEEPWRNDYQNCCMLLQEVDELQEDIRLERAKKLTAMNQAKHIRAIQKLHEQASWKITSCEKILKRIGSTGGYEETPEQKKLFSNIIMSLAMKIREKAKSLRQSQQIDLKMAKQLKQFNLNQIEDTNLMLRDDEAEEFDEQEFQALEHKLHEERNQEILKIVASIHSLNTLYRQLQTVVIEQGSLLDRIDENLDMAAQNIKQANVHLTKAQQHQKSPLANRVICILIASIMICLLILWMRS